MSFSTAEHFAKKHGGFEAIKRFTELVNSESDLYTIGTRFELSASQVCRLRSQLFEQVWKPKRGTLEYVEFQQNYFESEIQYREEFIKTQSELTFIPGAANGQLRHQ